MVIRKTYLWWLNQRYSIAYTNYLDNSEYRTVYKLFSLLFLSRSNSSVTETWNSIAQVTPIYRWTDHDEFSTFKNQSTKIITATPFLFVKMDIILVLRIGAETFKSGFICRLYLFFSAVLITSKFSVKYHKSINRMPCTIQ